MRDDKGKRPNFSRGVRKHMDHATTSAPWAGCCSAVRPERCANACCGGRHGNRLFMAASHSIHALYVNTQGL